MPLSSFASELVKCALAEEEKLAACIKGNPQLRTRIKVYCHDTHLPLTAPIDDYHYSAVFISWCMQHAGATCSEFRPTAAHWEYVSRSIRDAEQNAGLFHGRHIDSYRPQPGDVIDWSRQGPLSYERARNSPPRYDGHGGIVVAVKSEPEHIAQLVVGNDIATGSVVLQDVLLDSEGFIVQRPVDPYVCVIQNLK